MSGIFPNQQHGGLAPNPDDPNLPVQAFPPIIPPADTAALYYGNGCDVRLMPYVLNSLISEIASTVDRGEVAYRFASLQNLELAIRYLIQRGLPKGGVMVAQDDHAFTVTLDPPLTRYNDYLTLALVPQIIGGEEFNNGYVRVNVNGRGWVPILRYEGDELRRLDLRNNKPILVIYWQGAFYLASRISAALPLLTTNAHWYVNCNTGDDSNYDGTSPTVQPGRPGVGPFRQIQRAVTEQAKYNMNGWNQFIWVADGDCYVNASLRETNGVGTCFLRGNETSPGNVRVYSTADDTTTLYCVGGNWDVTGFRVSSTSNAMDGVAADGTNANLHLHTMQFGPCGRYHICSAHGANLNMSAGRDIIEAGANAQAHLDAELAANMGVPQSPPYIYYPDLVVQGAVNFGAFVQAGALGVVNWGYRSQSGQSAVTGRQYGAYLNGVIINANAPPRPPFPGNQAGTTGSGGQYMA